MAKEKQDSQPNKAREKTDLEVRRVRAQNHVHFYTNQVQVGFSNWDMWISFGELTGQEDEKLVLEDRAKVVMSLQHAKVFLGILSKTLMEFEKQTGEIRLISVGQDVPTTKQKVR